MKQTTARILTLVIALLVVADSFAADEIRIGCWNIEHLGNPFQRGGTGKGIDQNPDEIAEYIHAAKVDVLALEEIDDNDGVATTRRNSNLSEAFQVLNQSEDQDWEYILFRNKQVNDKTQLCGVAWNKKLKKLAQFTGLKSKTIPMTNTMFGIVTRAPFNSRPAKAKLILS
jgi:predicted extracellular nuclease